jgi:hypothetical protein
VDRVHLGDQVRDGELELVRAEAARLVRRHEAELGSYVLQDRRGLGDDDVTVSQRRRPERREPVAAAREESLDGSDPSAPPGDVIVRHAGVLEREPDELAATLEAGPVEEL